MKIKARPEDFKVTEILKDGFLSAGKNKFMVYRLEKRGTETEEALRKISYYSKVSFGKIRYGGLKDKNAVTSQYISVPVDFPLKEFHSENLILEFCGFSEKPVSPAFVEGNFFEITVIGGKLKNERIDVLRSIGVPNYYGEQRFTSVRNGNFLVGFLSVDDYRGAIFYLFTPAGWEGSRSRKGKKLFISGDLQGAMKHFSGWRKEVIEYLLRKPSDFRGAFSVIPRKEIEFHFNIYQSFLFNSLLSGLSKESGGSFISFKYKLGFLHFPLKKVDLKSVLPVYTPEIEKLYSEFLKFRFKKKWHGYFHSFKRSTFVKPFRFSAEETEEGYSLKFALPSGSYATNVLRFLFDAVRRKSRHEV